MDMYHTHEATRRHDKVYALLGMSSDDLSDVGLSPDYSVPWEELLQRLVKYLLCQNISVETWKDKREFAIIKSKGCILGKVSLEGNSADQSRREGIGIIVSNREKVIRLNIQVSANTIRNGDILCLLQGASMPTIVRPCHDYFDIIVIAVRISEADFLKRREYSFTRDLLLVWDWQIFSTRLKHPKHYTDIRNTKFGVLESPGILDDRLDKANRTWNVSLVLGDAKEYKKAEGKLHEAIDWFKLAFEVELHPLKGQSGLTPLLWAARNGYDAVVRELLRKGGTGIDLDLKDGEYGQTPLSWATKNGHEAVVKLLLETNKVDLDETDFFGRTPMSWAAGNGHKEVVELLLNTSKGDINKDDIIGRTPLSWAASNGHETVVKLLLNIDKVDVNIEDEGGRTPLGWAASNGYEAVVKLLLNTGKVDINIEDNSGSTPLFYAVRNRHEAVVKLLLNTGKVDTDVDEKVGSTPLLYAVRNRQEAVVRLLLNTGKVNVNKGDLRERTPLWWAANNKHEAVVKLLLDTGKVDVNRGDLSGRTPLWCATKKKHKAVVTLLLDTGKVDVNRKNQEGSTALG